MNYKSDKLNKVINWNNIFFLVLLGGYLIMTLFLFHRQSVGYAGRYVSDAAPYVAEIQGVDSGYQFPYPIMFWIGHLFSLFTTPQHALAITVTGLNGATAVFLKYHMDKYLLDSEADKLRQAVSTVLVFAILMLSMLYPLGYLGKTGEDLQYLRYKGVFTPNPYHNATYLAARPFSVLCFFMFADLISIYDSADKKKPAGKYVLFSLCLLAATMTKPSFTLILVCTAGFVMIWRLVRGKMKGWKPFLLLGICFIPTFVDLLYQYSGVFTGGSGEEKGIGFGFLKAWSTATDHIGLSILLAVAFPLTVLLFQWKKLKDDQYFRFSCQLFIVSLLSILLFYEKGYRLPHINFAWGYMYGLFFVFLTCSAALMKDTLNKKQAAWKLGIQWAVFSLHLVCGLDYFRVILKGGLYL